MTASVDSRVSSALRRAAVQATKAPSVHNTQPWRFVLVGGTLEVRSDRGRQLQVLDPFGRQLMISCGCALFNARVATEQAGYAVQVTRAPDAGDPSLVARVAVTGSARVPTQIGLLDAVIELRQTNRRQFAHDPVDPQVVDALVAAAAHEDALLVEIRHEERRLAIARLTQEADREQNADPAYRAELRAWTTDDPTRDDGVPARAVPLGGPGHHDDIPIRDLDPRGAGSLPTNTESSVRQCLLVLATADDGPEAWIRAGEALEHVWLEATRQGYTMSLFTQPIEIPWIRETLRRELQMSAQPHVIIRVGRAPRAPSTRRRRLAEVITQGAEDRSRQPD